MKINIDDVGYGETFEGKYPETDPIKLCSVFEYLACYKQLLQLQLNDPQTQVFKKIAIVIKMDHINKLQSKYQSLIEFLTDAENNTL